MIRIVLVALGFSLGLAAPSNITRLVTSLEHDVKRLSLEEELTFLPFTSDDRRLAVTKWFTQLARDYNKVKPATLWFKTFSQGKDVITRLHNEVPDWGLHNAEYVKLLEGQLEAIADTGKIAMIFRSINPTDNALEWSQVVDTVKTMKAHDEAQPVGTSKTLRYGNVAMTMIKHDPTYFSGMCFGFAAGFARGATVVDDAHDIRSVATQFINSLKAVTTRTMDTNVEFGRSVTYQVSNQAGMQGILDLEESEFKKKVWVFPDPDKSPEFETKIAQTISDLHDGLKIGMAAAKESKHKRWLCYMKFPQHAMVIVADYRELTVHGSAKQAESYTFFDSNGGAVGTTDPEALATFIASYMLHPLFLEKLGETVNDRGYQRTLARKEGRELKDSDVTEYQIVKVQAFPYVMSDDFLENAEPDPQMDEHSARLWRKMIGEEI